MKVENGKIIESTEQELFDYYLKRGLDDIYSFTDYLYRMKRVGVKIIDEKVEQQCQTN